MTKRLLPDDEKPTPAEQGRRIRDTFWSMAEGRNVNDMEWPRYVSNPVELREFLYDIHDWIDDVQAELGRGNVEKACERLSMVKAELLDNAVADDDD